MFAEQVRTSFLTAWLIVSAVILPVLLAPFVLPPQTIFSLAPQCQWKAKYGRECALCGMTTSFVLISNGELNAALERNRAGIPLYSALLWNELVALRYTLGELRQTWRLVRRRGHRLPTEEISCRS
jgi:Protein of unknown function (DUF2752)